MAAASLLLGAAVLAVTGGLGRERWSAGSVDGPGRAWNLDLIDAPDAWAAATGRGVIVAVVDTGIDARHPALRGRVLVALTCLRADGDPDRCVVGGDTDRDGHGTHVAGIVAGGADDRPIGVAPEADLIVLQALQADRCRRRPCGGSGRAGDVAAAIDRAVDEGADVVNLSLGADVGGVDDRVVAAIHRAWSRHVIVVLAGGTDTAMADLSPTVPAIVVTAVDHERQLAPYATGVGRARWGLAAPGGSALSDDGDGCTGSDAVRSAVPVPAGASEAYGCLIGTSMAAPHVSGALALLLSRGLGPEDAIDRLLVRADDLGDEGDDPVYGSGLLSLEDVLTT